LLVCTTTPVRRERANYKPMNTATVPSNASELPAA